MRAPQLEFAFEEVRLSNLSPPQAELVLLMQNHPYAVIESLRIVEGEPLFDGPVRVEELVKVGGERRADCEAGDFVLRQRVVDFLVELGEIGDGTIAALEVQDGLPFRYRIPRTLEVPCSRRVRTIRFPNPDEHGEKSGRTRRRTR